MDVILPAGVDLTLALILIGLSFVTSMITATFSLGGGMLMVVVLALWAGLRAVLPDDGSALAYALRFVRYALMGAWIAAGAPALFQKLGLAHQLVQ